MDSLAERLPGALDLGASLPDAAPAADWAGLPPELLRLCFLRCADLAHGREAIGLRDAARLLASLSPCRAWRAVALAEVRFRLSLAAAAELEHPLMRKISITKLLVPWRPPTPEGEEPDAALLEQQRDADPAAVTAKLAALLSLPDARARLSGCLAILTGLPCGAAVAHPGLLAGFRRLWFICLQDDGMGAALEDVPPSFFTDSMLAIHGVKLGILQSLHWLAQHPGTVVVQASGVLLQGPPAALAASKLTLLASEASFVSIAAMAGCDCQAIALSSKGLLALQPEAASFDEWDEQAQSVLAHCPSDASPSARLLVPWALALQPLFEAHSRLEEVQLSGSLLRLTFPPGGAAEPVLAGGEVDIWEPATLAPATEPPGPGLEAVYLDGKLKVFLHPPASEDPDRVELVAERINGDEPA